MANNVEIKGFNEFVKKLSGLDPDIRREANEEVRAAAYEWEALAKKDVRVGVTGNNGKRITSKSTGFMEAAVYAQMTYSPYEEWGTGDFVSVPADLAEYAIQFKGRKKVKGRPGKPFFFIQAPIVLSNLLKRLNNLASFK